MRSRLDRFILCSIMEATYVAFSIVAAQSTYATTKWGSLCRPVLPLIRLESVAIQEMCSWLKRRAHSRKVLRLSY